MMFSVVIPTYNRRHQIADAIDSALSQEGVDVEVIVVDDGSSDGTVDWLPVHYEGKRVSVMRNTHAKGPAGARNTGMAKAGGDFIALLDSDDTFLPGHLAECLATYVAHPEVGVIFGRALYEQAGQPVDYMGPNFARKLGQAPTAYSSDAVKVFTSDYFEHLLRFGCYFNLSTVVLRRHCVGQGMNESLRIAEDYEFWVRLSREHIFACLMRPQIRYLLHEENISFEAASSAADHAPSQLRAYEIMLAYPKLQASQRALIQHHMADILFNWGYRCRKHREFGQAWRLHRQSMQWGLRRENVLALVKLSVARVFPFLD